MNVARAVLAFLIAVSLAALPAAGYAAVAGKSADVSPMNHIGDDGMSAMDDMNCCPHKTDTSKKAIDDCAAMVGCVLCAGFLGANHSNLSVPLLVSSRAFSPLRGPLPSQKGSPPFRPPRI